MAQSSFGQSGAVHVQLYAWMYVHTTHVFCIAVCLYSCCSEPRSLSGFWANFGIKSEEFRGFTPGACATEISPCLTGNFFPRPLEMFSGGIFLPEYFIIIFFSESKFFFHFFFPPIFFLFPGFLTDCQHCANNSTCSWASGLCRRALGFWFMPLR